MGLLAQELPVDRCRGARRDARSAWTLLAPSLIILGVMVAYPAVLMVIQSFTDYTVRNKVQGTMPNFVGFENFAFVLGQPQFWIALRNTFSIFLISAVPQVIAALLIAAVLDRNLRAKTFWRMGVLLPYVVA